MEIPENVIIKAFAEIDTAPKHERLEELLEELNQYDVKKILFAEDDNLWENTRQIYSTFSKYLHTNHLENQDSVHQLSTYLTTYAQYFKKAVINGDIKPLLIFLSINCHFKIDISFFVESDINITKLSNNLTKFLENIKIEMQLTTNATYNDKHLKDIFIKGLKESGYDNIYKFILATERSSIGFKINCQLSITLIQYNKTKKNIINP